MRTRATITSITQETPTVRSFRLGLTDASFSFLPGQWVDCSARIGGHWEVAGYSMTSSPTTRGTLELAVKLAGDNPVTHFLHREARIGDELMVDGGHGDFYFDRGMGDTLVLCGGGIGLNPLMSILRYIDEVCPETRATLLYSAKTPDELLFRAHLEAMAEGNERIECVFTVTGSRPVAWGGRVGRIGAALIDEVSRAMEALHYICGPPEMIDTLAPELAGLGIPRDRIKYERWW